MTAVAEYSDLPEVDQPGAFRGFFREVVVDAAETPTLESGPGSYGVRLYTDLRLSAGLLVPLPILLWIIPNVLIDRTPGLENFLRIVSVVVFLVLLVECSQHCRRILRWGLADLATDERMGRLARAAMDSSRTRRERQRADERTS